MSAQRLLYYCPSTIGGVSDYAWEQAKSLSELGVEVTFLTPNASLYTGGNVTKEQVLEEESDSGNRSRLQRWRYRAKALRANATRLAEYAISHQFEHVLMACYLEYASPLWAGPLQRLSRSGVRIGTILHDPIRDYVVGPQWLHDWSVRRAYSFLSEAFVHEDVDRQQAQIPAHIRLSVIPHGQYAFPNSDVSGSLLRQRLKIPADAKVLLSFGQIRDGKNLDLAIGALQSFKNLWLLVAGKEAGGTRRPVTFYQQLAQECGVAERCRWVVDYIPGNQVGSFFEASDLILLTYSHHFRSASGVLSAATHFQRPCLASSGAGPLRTQVEEYKLGVWVEPDQQEAIQKGLNHWLGGLAAPQWGRYREENSWRRNAEIVRKVMFQLDA